MKEELMELRQKMKEYGMAAYLIVSDDFHASEYVGEYFKCREYISGFSGSAGTLVITEIWQDSGQTEDILSRQKNSLPAPALHYSGVDSRG